ncbi:pseudouridine synthase [Ferroacidibacillus organovorans]|uniref:Pseudouridine synthase n=1 Tax=Ferroacidibacillus organovorans TaxID=1765683 RepID=A0A124IW07_9BACL|nr:pseudouridine synthase [Ferroacidibacillus organovorans]
MKKDEKKETQRLQKVLAHAGVASRRAAEELIRQGRVRVDGGIVTELGMQVRPDQTIEVDGASIHRDMPPVYILLYKPRGVVTTSTDPQGRKTVLDLISGVPNRIYPVGRLDYDTKGALLLTDDGALTHRLMHPSYEIEKVYRATVAGDLSERNLLQLTEGIELDGKKTAPAVVNVIGTDGKTSVVELILHEGRNRQVRRMFEAVGHPVLDLTRTRYGHLSLTALRPGSWRKLTDAEIRQLYRLCRLTMPQSLT